MRALCVIVMLCAAGCSHNDAPISAGTAEKQDTTSVTLTGLVHFGAVSADPQHPLVCGTGGDFPAGREMTFGYSESQGWIHAVFPEGVTPPKDLNGNFVLHGRYQGIQNWDRYTLKKPRQDYQYFVVSSWEHEE